MVSGFSQGSYINRQEKQKKKNSFIFRNCKRCRQVLIFCFNVSSFNRNIYYLTSARISWYAHFLSLKLFVPVTRLVLEGYWATGLTFAWTKW
jgi:hypothetical protein